MGLLWVWWKSLGKTGKIKGNITAGEVINQGSVEGNVVAKDKLEISQTGKVKGDVKTGLLKIDIGGVLEGNCNMNLATEEKKKK